MKLIRWGAAGKEKTGVIINDVKYDTSAFGGDYNEEFFEDNGLERLEEFVKANEGALIEIPAGSRLGSPIARPSKILCIGLNYANHAKETNAQIPAEPIIFMKSTTSLVGPNDPIVIPKNSVKTDWEVELAIVIGKKASYVDEADALDYVAGYTLHNDVSEREFQLEKGGTWDKGKGCDTFAPMGPFLATPDELGDVHNLRRWLSVNLSQFMALLPGDVISTGTPAGVGLGFNPPVYLKEGDVVELGIDGLGTAKQELKAYVKQG
jgi:2,4-diketo-3-deoxy-L-fuconate hydrolase